LAQTIEDMQEKERHIDFGTGQKWSDVEADEATFHKQNLGKHSPESSTTSCLGAVAWNCEARLPTNRGRLNPKMSEPRPPGPAAIRKVEWLPLAKTWLKDKCVILHTDVAKSYKCKIHRWCMSTSSSARRRLRRTQVAMVRPKLRSHGDAQGSRHQENIEDQSRNADH